MTDQAFRHNREQDSEASRHCDSDIEGASPAGRTAVGNWPGHRCSFSAPCNGRIDLEELGWGTWFGFEAQFRFGAGRCGVRSQWLLPDRGGLLDLYADLCDKSIPALRKGLDVSWAAGVVAEDGPELIDGIADGVIVVEVFPFGPHELPQVFAADHGPSPLQQDRQEPRRLLGKTQLEFAPRQFSTGGVETEWSKAECGLCHWL